MLISTTKIPNNLPAIKNGECQFCLSRDIKNYFDENNNKVSYCQKCTLNNRKIDSKTYFNLKNLDYEVNTKFNNNLPINKSQKAITNKIVKEINNDNNVLLKAVCGAGKTNIFSHVIKLIWKNKDKIIYISPRKNLTFEMYTDFSADNQNSIKLISSENFDKTTTKLNFATVHQLINYYQEFDLIIFDECDAYPFTNNQNLLNYLLRSLKNNGNILFLSATTNGWISKITHDFNCKKYEINLRHHQLPITIPKILKMSKTSDFKQLFLNLQTGTKLIIFVPTKEIGLNLKRTIGQSSMFISSSEQGNTKLINNFKAGKVKILISTIILERGFNLGNLDVVVLLPEHHVFKKESLVQICGRVNRNAENQNGSIVFVQLNNSLKIKSVIKKLKRHNKKGQYEKMCELPE